MEKKIIDRLNALKSEKQQVMVQANKMDGATSARLNELTWRIDELQRLLRK